MKVFNLQDLLRQGGLAFHKAVKYPFRGMNINDQQEEFSKHLKPVTHYSGKSFHTRTGTRGNGMGLGHQTNHHKR